MNVAPLTGQRLPDLARLFGPNGANSGCWCMWWRVSAAQWTTNGNAGNRAAFEGVVRAGEPAGLLAYDAGTPVGWVAVAPRNRYPRLVRSRTLGLSPADEPDLWAVTCFYIDRHHRRAGVAAALLSAAVDHARAHGARAVEGYPVDTAGDRRPSGDLFTGTVGLFTAAGFRVHSRPASGKRVVVRLSL